MADFLTQAHYLPLTIGLFIGGTPALIGAMFLVVSGLLDLKILSLIALSCTVTWDALWYILGRFLPFEKIEKWRIFRNKQILFQTYYAGFDKHKHKLLFCSRFVYGMNGLFSIISGILRMRFGLFMFLSFSSMVIWITVIYIISMTFRSNAMALGIANDMRIFIPIFIIGMVIFIWAIKKLVYRVISKTNDFGVKED